MSFLVEERKFEFYLGGDGLLILYFMISLPSSSVISLILAP
jgi:hypothetical protein